MTPVCLNPASSSFPFVDLKEEQHLQLFLSPHQAATSLSGPTNFFNTTHEQRESKLAESRQHDDHEVDKYSISLGRSSDHKLFPSSSFQPVVNDDDDDSNFHKLFSSKTEDGTEGSCDSSGNWMPSRMTMMQEMTNSNRSETDHQPMKFMLKFYNQQCQNTDNNSSSNSNIRVCSDCNTTSTPLWRSGPRGPKSLCNACGIRQRKARRAMAAAAAAASGTVIAIEASSSTRSTKVNNKVKKSRTSHVSQNKKLSKPPESSLQNHKKLCFKNLALSLSKNPALQQVLPQDVEEAAILLMELSCGFIHS